MLFKITKRIDLTFDEDEISKAKWEAITRCESKLSKKEYFLLGSASAEKIIDIYNNRKELSKKYPYLKDFCEALEDSFSYDFTKCSHLATYEATKLDDSQSKEEHD